MQQLRRGIHFLWSALHGDAAASTWRLRRRRDWNKAAPIWSGEQNRSATWWRKAEGRAREGESSKMVRLRGERAGEGGDGERSALGNLPERRRRDTQRERKPSWKAILLDQRFSLFFLFLASDRRKASLLEMLLYSSEDKVT